MVDMSGNYTFNYNLTNVTPDINDSTAFTNWTDVTWEGAISSGFNTWLVTYGDWFWLIPVVVVPLMALIKYEDVQPAAILLTLTSALCITVVAPVTVSVIYALYALLIMGVVAAFIGALVRR